MIKNGGTEGPSTVYKRSTLKKISRRKKKKKKKNLKNLKEPLMNDVSTSCIKMIGLGM